MESVEQMMKVPRGMLRKRRDSMSQAKVDRYKQEKKNRDKIIKKEKRQLAAMKAGVSVVAIALVAWVGVSVYHGLQSEDTTTAEKPSYTVNTSSLDEFITGLNTDDVE